ncbi:hypothetical protein DUGA6_63190 [Duganella sp. HH105]|nr:hypothetical protein DUGA6_63190 [Duganella sp. HH105]
MVHAYRAPHQLHQLFGDRQSQAGAAVLAGGGAVGLREGIENARARFAGDADAGIVHFETQADGLRILVHHGHLDRDLAAVGELDGVAQQVEDDLAQPVRIAADGDRDIVGDRQFQADALGLRLWREDVVDIVEQLAEIEMDVFDGQLAGLDLGKIQDVVDDDQQVLARALDHAGVVALLFGQARGQQQFGHAEHAVHRRADFVAHGGEEGALRLAGGLGGVLGFFQLLGAHADLAFELVAVLRQRAVARLDLGQHVVEAVGQRAQLVAALVDDARRRLAAADLLRRRDQLADRLGDAALEARRRQQRHHEGQHGGHGGGGQVLEQVDPHARLRAFDQHGADEFVVAAHRTQQPHRRRPRRAAVEGAHFLLRLRLRQLFRRFLHAGQGGRGVARQQLAGAVVQRGLLDLVLHRQRGQHLLGPFAVGDLQGRHAVVADHAGQRRQLLALVVGAAEDGGGGKRDEDQHQRAAGGQHGDDGQLLAQTGTFEIEHCCSRWLTVDAESVGAAG